MPPLWFLAASALIAFSLDRQVLWTLIRSVTNIPLHGNTPLAYLVVLASAFVAHNVFVRFVPHVSLWPHHLVAVFSCYGFYSYLRNSLGSTAGVLDAAAHNARRVVHLERALRLDFEPALQRFWMSLPFKGGMTLLGGYYTVAHALVTALVLVFLYRTNRSRYAYALGTIGVSCVIALLCFRFFPTMPPRLYALRDQSFNMTDALSTVATSATNAELSSMSNQYAAIPSMHCAWAFFSLLMLRPYKRLRILALIHFVVTVFIVITTAHHFWLDAVLGSMAASLFPLLSIVWSRVKYSEA
jgi:hypothetical protein